ncbi:MAG: two-component sensor histidine kinase [Myxococcales bacterium]|nr:two-component sensor histidine kinase [Myxococcales bacterium]
MSPLSFRSWAPRGPLVLAVVVSVLLLGAVLLIRRSVERGRDAAIRGVAAGLVIAGREQLRQPDRLDAAELAAFLDEQRGDGLRYVAVIDARGAIAAEAGVARGRQVVPGLHRAGERLRLVQPQGGRRARPARVTAIVYEFEPLVADQLAGDTRWLVAAAAGAIIVVLALGVLVDRGQRARARMVLELERGKRLAALGEMSAVLAHELRNPLASLKGHAQLLEEALAGAPAHAKAARVVGEAVRIEALTNDLLEFVRTGALHRAAVAPAELAREVVDEAGAGRVDLFAEAAPATWSLDPARLRQALVNVIRNAVQASPEGARVDVTIARERDQLIIAIRDRGAGIPPGEEAAVFEPFHTRRARGVGLGLAIARRVVELHGGTITAGSHADGGAVFRLVLPRGDR